MIICVSKEILMCLVKGDYYRLIILKIKKYLNFKVHFIPRIFKVDYGSI